MSGEDAPPLPSRARLDPSRHDYEAIVAAHRTAVQAGHAFYRDPTTGLSVFTSAALEERGWCCERQCRHCPFVERLPEGPAPTGAEAGA